MKVKSQITKNKNGVVISIEEFIYNELGLLVRQDFKDKLGKLTYFQTFKYDIHRNCIQTITFSNENKGQGSFEYVFDNNNTLIRTIERTIDGSIYDWTEFMQQPENNLNIWLAKDNVGNIIHRTEENLLDHSEKRFNEQGKLYELHYKKFDQENRLLEKLITNSKGDEIQKSLYEYQGQKEIWEFILNGSRIKTEERIYDNNNNLTYYIRKDSNGKFLEWWMNEFDKFGNKNKLIWGHNEGQPFGFITIDLIYE